jgi:porin
VTKLKFRLRAVCIFTIACTVGHSAFAQDTTAPAIAGTTEGPRLSVQSAAASPAPGLAPITLRLQYTGEAADNPIGGIRNGASYMNQILAQLHADTDRFGWGGGKVILEAFYENQTSLNDHYVGAFQDPSLIDSGGAMFRVYQAYYSQDLGSTNLLFGIYDAETEFGISRPMDVFFNGASAWTSVLDQSGLNGPSTYPNTSLAFRARQKLGDQWSIQAAVLDGVPDSIKQPDANAVILNRTNGALLIGEVDYTPTRTSKIMAGYWNYTGKFDALGQTNTDETQRQVFGSRGGYIGGATRLYSQTARRGLDGFVNLGISGSTVSMIDRSLDIGVTYTGLLDARPYDRMGVAVGIVAASSPYKAMQVASGSGVRNYETNLELTWRAPITSWLTVQPDIQYWINPGLNPSVKNDLMFMLHFEISHVFGL